MNEDVQLSKKERKELKKQKKAMELDKQERAQKIQKWSMYAGVVAAILLAGWFVFSRQVSIPSGEENKPANQVLASDWVKGNPEAEIVLVEYSDFQCPACSAYQQLLTQIMSEFGDQVALVYRHYPLRQIHLQADLAAQASEAAGKQGKFWEMHDLLFQNQEAWAENRKARQIFEEYAQQLGLNVDQFKTDMGSKEVKGLVEADYISGVKLQINATPTFFLNGQQLENPTSVEAFADLIRSQLPASPAAEIETNQ